nr:M50 family metallopeptidase [Aquibacillus halophilus]
MYYILIAYFITKMPVIGSYFRMINTAIHECSHVVIAKLTGGKAYRIVLNRDTSGHALVGSSSWLSGIVIAYSGYTGSSLTAFMLFFLLSKGYYFVVLSVLLSILVVATIFWLRSIVGILWSVSMISLLALLLNNQLDSIIIHFSYLLASVVLLESVASAAYLMFISIKQPNQAGDATSLQKYTMIPAFAWGILFFVQSIYIGYRVFSDFVV